MDYETIEINMCDLMTEEEFLIWQKGATIIVDEPIDIGYDEDILF